MSDSIHIHSSLEEMLGPALQSRSKTSGVHVWTRTESDGSIWGDTGKASALLVGYDEIEDAAYVQQFEGRLTKLEAAHRDIVATEPRPVLMAPPQTPKSPLLEQMDVERIFSIQKNDDSTFTIIEECDHYFEEDLTRDELRRLGEEIIAFSEKD